jgi:hypothetical protein
MLKNDAYLGVVFVTSRPASQARACVARGGENSKFQPNQKQVRIFQEKSLA